MARSRRARPPSSAADASGSTRRNWKRQVVEKASVKAPSGCMFLESLPLEVLSLVASHCSPKDLLNLGACSNTLYETAIACPQSFWARIILPSGCDYHNEAANDLEVERMIQLMKFISLRPHLVERLREVHLHTSRAGDRALNTTMFSTLAKLIRMKPHLEKLAIHGELFGEELPIFLLDLIFDLPHISQLSFVAISWPRNHTRPALKPTTISKRVLQRLVLVAAHTAFIAQACNAFGEIELLDMAHCHGQGIVGTECAGLWRRTRGLVVGVHATHFVLEQFRQTTNQGNLRLETLFLHESLSRPEYDILVRCLSGNKCLKRLALHLPAAIPPAYVEALTRIAPELETLALNLDHLGTAPDARTQQWSIQTRRGTVTADMPEDVSCWQDVLMGLLPAMNAHNFPHLCQLVIRHPGTKLWTTARDPRSEPDALLTSFFERAFAAIPSLKSGALAWRCCQVGRGDGYNTLSLEADADVEYRMGIVSAIRWTWQRSDRPSTQLRTKEIEILEDGFDHPLIRDNAFPDELPTL